MDEIQRIHSSKHNRSTSFSNTYEYVNFHEPDPSKELFDSVDGRVKFGYNTYDSVKDIFQNNVPGVFLGDQTEFTADTNDLLDNMSLQNLLDETRMDHLYARRRSMPSLADAEDFSDSHPHECCSPLDFLVNKDARYQSQIILSDFPRGSQMAECIDQQPYVCTQCTADFARKHDLKRHLRIHSGDKPFVCTLCERSFARNDALSRHKRRKSCTSE
jgi:uncharacterized Zn-finger protein